MKRIIRLTESDLTRIVRRVLSEQEKIPTLPVKEIPNPESEQTILSPIEVEYYENKMSELEKQRYDLKLEYEKLDELTGKSIGRFKNKMDKIEESLKQKIEEIKDNIISKSEKIKNQLIEIRDSIKEKRQIRQKNRKIKKLEIEIEKFEKGIEQLKRQRIFTNIDLEEFHKFLKQLIVTTLSIWGGLGIIIITSMLKERRSTPYR
jgi:chromosome segregation ATPase